MTMFVGYNRASSSSKKASLLFVLDRMTGLGSRRAVSFFPYGVFFFSYFLHRHRIASALGTNEIPFFYIYFRFLFY